MVGPEAMAMRTNAGCGLDLHLCEQRIHLSNTCERRSFMLTGRWQHVPARYGDTTESEVDLRCVARIRALQRVPETRFRRGRSRPML